MMKKDYHRPGYPALVSHYYVFYPSMKIKIRSSEDLKTLKKKKFTQYVYKCFDLLAQIGLQNDIPLTSVHRLEQIKNKWERR